ncbi:MAG: pyridoxamine 5'-phosphate oxidase family protein [Nitrososphaerales archaeon]
MKIIRKDISDLPVKRSLFRILKGNVLCSMATVMHDREAHINTAYFAYSDEPELFYVSYPDSIHSQNLLENPSMAITVFNSKQTWGRADTGVQLFGSCREAKGRWRGKAERVYGRRFPGLIKWKNEMVKEEGAFLLRFFRFVPVEAKIFDEKEFGGGVFVVVQLHKQKR